MTSVRRGPGGPLPFSHYDRRSYPTVGIEEGYALWSRVYGDYQDRFDLDVLEGSAGLVSRIEGRAIVDLACGNGRIGKWLREKGAASVDGVDRSRHMLDVAAGRGVYAELRNEDITKTSFERDRFEGATSSMALCHVDDLGAFFREAHRILRPGAWLAIVDYHPHFLMNGIPSHFDHPDTGASIAVTNHVHAHRDYFQQGTRAGLTLVELEERFIDDEWVATMPRYGRYVGHPVTTFWLFEK